MVATLFHTMEQWLWHSIATVAMVQHSHRSVVQNGYIGRPNLALCLGWKARGQPEWILEHEEEKI
jgi:hypothetical protein